MSESYKDHRNSENHSLLHERTWQMEQEQSPFPNNVWYNFRQGQKLISYKLPVSVPQTKQITKRPSVLSHCLLGNRKCIRPVKIWVLNAGIFVPKTIRSLEHLFPWWNFRSQDHSFPGTFVPWTIRSLEFSFLPPFVPWTIRPRDRILCGKFIPLTTTVAIHRSLCT